MQKTFKLYAVAALGTLAIALAGCGAQPAEEQVSSPPARAGQTEPAAATPVDFTPGVGVVPSAEQLAAADIKNLDLPLYAGNLTVVPGDSYSLTMGDELRKHYECRLDDNTLAIVDTSKDKWWNKLKNVRNEDITLVLTFPAERADFETVALNVGVGSGDISGFSCVNFDLVSGVSETTISNVAAQQMTITGGVGEITGRDLTAAQSLDVKSGVGSTDLRGDFTGTIEIKAGIGELTMHLARPQSAYTVETHKGLGKLTTGSKSTAAPAEKNDTESVIDLTSGVGDITLQFTPED